MWKREIGANGMKISPIGIGCWSFGGGAYWGEQKQRDVERVVREALDAGLNFFDTARMYNAGASERSLGDALKGVRDKAIICSKVSPANAYRDALKRECEASLRNLRTDTIDLYMMHWPINVLGLRHFTQDQLILDNPPTNEEAFSTLEELRKEGKIREIGVSNYGLSQMREALTLCPDIVANELPYNILSRAIEAEIIPLCVENDVAVISSMTLQQGVLAGIYQTADDVPPPQAHSRHFRQERGKEASRHYEQGAEEEVFATVKVLAEMAVEMNVTVAQLSIAWVLDNPAVACALVGSRNAIELMDNIGAMKIVLSADIKAGIDTVSQSILDKLGNNPDYYENSRSSRIY